jgi:hypothetical protein
MIGVITKVKGAGEVAKWARSVPDKFHRETVNLVRVYGHLIQRDAVRAAPVAKSILRSSIHVQFYFSGRVALAVVGTDVHYAPHLEYGTGLWGPKHSKYPIVPVKKKALAWLSPVATNLETGKAMYRSAKRPGRLVSTKSAAAKTVRMKVMHPGIAPRPYLIPAFRYWLLPFQKEMLLLVAKLNKGEL